MQTLIKSESFISWYGIFFSSCGLEAFELLALSFFSIKNCYFDEKKSNPLDDYNTYLAVLQLPIHYTNVWFSQFCSHFLGTMHCLPQRLKSTLFEIFTNEVVAKRPEEWEKISNNVDFSLWGNRETT